MSDKLPDTEAHTFTMNDVQGFLGINYARQNMICLKAGIKPKRRDGGQGYDVAFYTAAQFRKFLKAAGYLHAVVEGKHVLVNKKYIKEHPRTEVIT